VAGSGGERSPRASYLISCGAIISGLRDVTGGLTVFGLNDPLEPTSRRGGPRPPARRPSAIIGTQCERSVYGRAGRWRRRPSTIPCIVLVAPDISSWRWRRSAPIRLAVCCHCPDQSAIASRPASTAPVVHSIA
jgi:hypothetical protein